MGGLVRAVEADSAAHHAGIQPGDEVVSINGHLLRDVIDAQFYGAEEHLHICYLRRGTSHEATVRRHFGQPLGLIFEHPTFDVDIRRCNNLCPFCFVLQNAPRMRRALYIKDDDYRYSFLFGHYVTLTNLSDEDWRRIAQQRLTPLYVSVHATDPVVRRRCLRNDHAPDVMEQLRWLADHGIQTHTQLVITPGLNDGPHLVRSITDLATLYPHVMSITVVPVGLTKFHRYGHRTHTPAEARAMLDEVERWQAHFLSQFGRRFVYATDEWYLISGRAVPPRRAYDGLDLRANGLGMVREFLNEWRRIRRSELPLLVPDRLRYRSALLVTAALFAPVLWSVGRQFTQRSGVPVKVKAVTNQRLGERITVAGLLCAGDVINQLRADPVDLEAADLVVLPRLMFDHPQSIALDDLSPLDVARAIEKPVALADGMGDVVDALRGRSKLVFHPTQEEPMIPVASIGGWAVEKCL
ncbi:MAG: DUF512 domain-containing protein [Thermoflexales bacterium]